MQITTLDRLNAVATSTPASIANVENRTTGRIRALLSLALAGGLAVMTGNRGQGAPNVVVMLFDDMGFSDLGCYGGEARTPNIDRLAAGGIRFRNFHNTARCSPTRMSLLTGLYTQQVATEPGKPLPQMRTDDNITMAEMLRTAGYRTYMAGKWHLSTTTEQQPQQRGFQHVFTPAPDTGTIDYWTQSRWVCRSQNNEIPTRSYGSKPYEFYSTDAIGDYAVDFLNHHFGKKDAAPFFMYLAFNAPHFNIAVDKAVAEFTPSGGQSYLSLYSQGWDVARTDRYQRMRAMGVIDPLYVLPPMSDTHNNGNPDIVPVPAWTTLAVDRQADLARRMALYTAMIEKLDQSVGRVITRLNEGGQLDNTLIFILSDNGACAEGGVFGFARTGSETDRSLNHAPLTGTDLAEMGQPFRNDHIAIGGGWADVGNTPFRMYKQFIHEGGVRTPLIVHWPAGITNAGRWSNQSGHVIDVMRTVVAVTGATYPSQYGGHPVLPMEGENLLPIFKRQAEFSRTIGFEHDRNRGWVDGHWKLVTKNFASVDGSSPANALELYDLAADPTELHNLASSQPAQVDAMVQAWNTWAIRVGVPGERLISEGSENEKSAGSPDAPKAKKKKR